MCEPLTYFDPVAQPGSLKHGTQQHKGWLRTPAMDYKGLLLTKLLICIPSYIQESSESHNYSFSVKSRNYQHPFKEKPLETFVILFLSIL